MRQKSFKGTPLSSKMSDISEIQEYLAKLKMKLDRVPTLADHKKAYKDLLSQHPDRAGKDATKDFQEITEAARNVLEFILNNPKLQKQVRAESETQEHKETLRYFEKYNKVIYNKMSVTFSIEPSAVDAWKKAFEKKLGVGQAMADNTGFQYKKDKWSIESVSTASNPVLGSVSICFWSNTTHTVLVQGSHYMAFMTFAIPGMIKSIYKKSIQHVEKNGEDDAAEKTVADLDLSVTENDVLVDGFKTLELEVYSVRKEIIGKVDLALQEISASNEKTVDDMNKKMEKLEARLDDNKSEMEKVHSQLSVIVDQTKHNGVIDEQTFKELAIDIANATLEKGNIENIGKTILEVKKDVSNLNVKEVLEGNKEILSKLDKVGGLCDTFKDGLTKLESIFEKDIFRDVASNSAKSASALEKMNEHMVNLLSKISVPALVTPAKEPETPKNSEPAPKHTAAAKSSNIRNVKMFTSSIALQCDKDELAAGLNCNLDVIKTFHISEHVDARDPEKYLKNMIDENLSEGDETDFVIFVVGSNDISKLDIENDTLVTLNNKVCDQSKDLVHFANYAAQKFGVDVFVVERPPRYDKEKNDPKAVKQMLNQAANGLLLSLVTPIEKVHLIKLPDLENLSGKVRKGIYQHDGIHVTNRGASILANHLISGVREVFKDIPIPLASPMKNQYKSPPPTAPDGNDWRNYPQQAQHDGHVGRSQPHRDQHNDYGGRSQPHRDQHDGYVGRSQPHRDQHDGYGGRSYSHQGQHDGYPGVWHGQRGQGFQGGPNRYGREQNRFGQDSYHSRRRDHDMPDMVRDYLMSFNNNSRYGGRNR